MKKAPRTRSLTGSITAPFRHNKAPAEQNPLLIPHPVFGDHLTYAMVTSLYDNGGDYLDCFWPVAISVLRKDLGRDLESIQLELNAASDLEIPRHVLYVVDGDTMHLVGSISLRTDDFGFCLPASSEGNMTYAYPFSLPIEQRVPEPQLSRIDTSTHSYKITLCSFSSPISSQL
jgi:hypothetical protein